VPRLRGAVRVGSDDVWLEKCRGDLPASREPDLPRFVGVPNGCIYRRSSHKVGQHKDCSRKNEKLQFQDEPLEVRIQGVSRQVFRVRG
jgi:hypothetical protein